MQSKFNSYTKELDDIRQKLSNCPQVLNISSKNFSQYQSLIKRKEFLQNQISQKLQKRTNIIGTYNDKITLLDSRPLSCKKYCKTAQKFEYKRDCSLYKLGFLDKKPVKPFVQNLKSYISDNILWPYSVKKSDFKEKFNSFIVSSSQKSIVCKKILKTHNYIHNELPCTLTNRSISALKKVIIGYRKISSSFNKVSSKFTRNISSSASVKQLSYIINSAKLQADFDTNSFRSRIKVSPSYYSPDYFKQTPCHIPNHVSHNISNGVHASNKPHDYEIAL